MTVERSLTVPVGLAPSNLTSNRSRPTSRASRGRFDQRRLAFAERDEVVGVFYGKQLGVTPEPRALKLAEPDAGRGFDIVLDVHQAAASGA